MFLDFFIAVIQSSFTLSISVALRWEQCKITISRIYVQEKRQSQLLIFAGKIFSINGRWTALGGEISIPCYQTNKHMMIEVNTLIE